MVVATHTLTRESHKNPDKFRISYQDANARLGEKPVVPKNDQLPVKESLSKVTIIGGGFGGIATAMTLKKKFNMEDFTMFEKHAQLGGT